MKAPDHSLPYLRSYRNSRLYRSLTRTLRVYNRRLVAELHARGFEDFSPSFPPILSNLDTEGTRVGVLASRAGVTRQAAGQLLTEIERCGYAQRTTAPDDARAAIISFTPRGKRLLATIFTLVEEIEAGFASTVGKRAFDRVRDTLARIADDIDPDGAFGVADEQPAGAGSRSVRGPRDPRSGRRR
jgi:DNA-binding MarR family transcriptional regulator